MALADIRRITKKVTEKYEHGVVDVKSNTLVRKITFDSPQLTFMFGGFSYDRIHQQFGPESSGKSSVFTYMAGQLQKRMPIEIERLAKVFEDEGKPEKAAKTRKNYADKQVVVYLDFEGTFDPGYATKLGLNCDDDHLILIQADSMEDGFTMADEYVRSGSVCCLIFDSDAAASTNLDNESEIGSTGFNGAKGANTLKEIYKRFNTLCRNYLTPMLVVSQERANMNVMSHLPSQTGGTAVRFFASTRNRVTKVETIKDPKTGLDCGIKIRVRNYKNKTGTPWRDAEMNLYFDRGFDSDAEYFDFLVLFGLMEKGNGGVYSASFFTAENGVPTGKIRGAENVKNWLIEHRDIYEDLKRKVDAKLMGSNELDANAENPEASDMIEVAKKTGISMDKLAEEALNADKEEKELETEVKSSGEEEPPEIDL